jgi:hypothetical protein
MLGFDEDGVTQMDCAPRAYLREHSHVRAMVLGAVRKIAESRGQIIR